MADIPEKRRPERRRIKRPRLEPVPRGCPPRWAWFFAGLLIGVFGAFLFYLYELLPNQLTPNQQLAQQNMPELQYEPYDFNLGLADVGVVETPSETLNIQNTQNTQTVPNKTATLQVGSFRDSSYAEGLKTHLQSLGIQARIEPAVEAGLSWHRVRIGPFDSEQQLLQVQNQLKINNIPFTVVAN